MMGSEEARRALLTAACALLMVSAGFAAQEKEDEETVRVPARQMEAWGNGGSANVAPNIGTASTAPPSRGFAERYPRYQLAAGDVFDLAFAFTPDFNQTISIQPDGYVTLRDIGDLQVQGMTVPQLTEALKKAYGKILRDPEITIVLKDFQKPYFTASGAVGRPGKYELRGPVTVSEAVAMAGGFTDKAKHSQVLLFRRVSDDWFEVKKLNVKSVLQGKYQEDVHLRPGDMVFVPQNFISKIKQFLPNAGLNVK